MFDVNSRGLAAALVPAGRVPAMAMPFPDVAYYAGEQRAEESFNPLSLLWYLVHYRWMLAAFACAALVAGLIGTWLQTPIYRASAQVEILTPGAKVFQELEIVSQASDFRAFETARLKMTSRDLARRVVFDLTLAQDEKFLAPAPRFSPVNLINRATGRSVDANLAGLGAGAREELAVSRVINGLTIELIRNTSVLAVTYRHSSPKYAADVANQVARSYIDQSVDRTSQTSDLARQFIEQQVRDTKTRLHASERALVDYAKQAGITITGRDGSLITENISQLNTALAGAIQDRLSAERLAEQVRQGNAAALPEVFANTSIQDTKKTIAELKASYQEKLGTLKPGFPEMRNLQAQIAELQRQVANEIEAIGKSVEIRHLQTIAKEEALRRELADLNRQQSDFQDKNIQYTILKRDADSNRAQYDSLIGKLNEIGIGAELKHANASIVDLAVVPRQPFMPDLRRSLGISLMLFGALAAALIYILELMNNNFITPDQIERELKLPVLGIIPIARNRDILEMFGDAKSSISEAYRSLRTSLQFTGTEGAMRTILVTSSEPSEGKSTTVFKLAQDFAALGRKVLVIDADLRKPRMHRLFNTVNTMGLSNLLSNVVRKGEVVSIFHPTQFANVTLLPAGTIPPNPVDLLTSQRMALTLHYCAKKYDLVLIDSPPVMGISDGPLLSRQADATLLVVSAKQVTRKAAKTALSRLKAAGGHVVGAAFTKFEVSKLDYNYAYRYMNYYYYNYGNDSAQIAASDGTARAARDSGPKTGRAGFFGRVLRGAA